MQFCATAGITRLPHGNSLPWLFLLFSLLFLCSVLPSQAGRVEALPDRTVFHVTVHDWMWEEIDPARTATSIRANAAAVREFERRFPIWFAERYRDKYAADPARYGDYNWDKVEVRIEKFSGIKVEGVESDLLAIAGKVAPDIIYLNFRKSDTYIQNGFLYPMDKPEDGYFSAMSEEEKAFRIHPKVREVIQRKGPGGEHVWALPHGGTIGKIIIFRKDRFDEIGLGYPNADWDWDDLYAACQKLADPARGRTAIALRNSTHESWRWLDFLMATGSEVLRYDASAATPADAWKVAFDDPEHIDKTVTALEYYVKLCTEPWTDATGKPQRGYAYRDSGFAAANLAWKNGDIAMLLGTIQEEIFLKSFDPTLVGIAPMPKGPTGIRNAALNSKMMSLYADIPHPALRDAAWEFIRWYDSDEAVAIKTKKLVEGGLGRFVNPTRLEKYGYPELIRFAPPGWRETFETATNESTPEPYGRFANPVYDILDKPIKKANQLALSDRLPTEPDERAAVLRGLIEDAGGAARREILGEVPAEEMRKRRATAAVFLIALTLVFAAAFWWIAKLFKAPPGPKIGSRRAVVVACILAPALLTIFFWQYIPLVRGSIMAFQDYKIMGSSEWVWLDNFGNVLFNGDWWLSVWDALRYSFLVMALTFLPPVGLAILLQEVPRGKILYRTIYYLPHVFTGIVVILLWKRFYGADSTGLLNRVIMHIPAIAFLALGAAMGWVCVMFARRLFNQESYRNGLLWIGAGLMLLAGCVGLAMPALSQMKDIGFFAALFSGAPEALDWLGDTRTAMIACVIPLVWAGIGPGCLIYLAALKGIPDELYEAADMDGATFIDKILFIIFPIFKPLLIINFVGVFIGAWFYSSGNILAMTGGQARTEVAGLHIFYKAFMYLKFGPATAMAWILGFMLILFTMYQLRILSRLEFRAAGSED